MQPPAAQGNIVRIVASGLCTGCGTCVSACPRAAIAMRETPGGLLAAAVDPHVCNSCGLCEQVCPASHLAAGFLSADEDPFRGRVLAAYLAQAADSAVLEHAQSGGAVSALLCHLLDRKCAEAALVCQMPEDGSMRPIRQWARNRGDVLRCQGSKYCPVAANACFGRLGARPAERIVFTGLPCQVHGVRNAQAAALQSYRSISLVIGLICDRMLTFGAMDSLLEASGLARREVESFEFRNAEWRGWPGDVCIRTVDGMKHFLPRELRLKRKEVFTPPFCHLCFDKFNTLADIVAGDAHGFDDCGDFRSVLLVRTALGMDTVLAAERAGAILLQPVAPEIVFKNQGLDLRRRCWSAATAEWGRMGKATPDFGIGEQWRFPARFRERLDARRRLQRSLRLAASNSAEEALRVARHQLRVDAVRRRVFPAKCFRHLLALLRNGMR